MEAGVHLDQGDHSQVAHHCDCVDDEEDPKQGNLKLRLPCDSHQNEPSQGCEILLAHLVQLALLGRNREVAISFHVVSFKHIIIFVDRV